jgi:hypothetical protein
VTTGVNELERGLVGGRGLPHVQAIPEARLMQALDDRLQPLGPFGMTGTRFVAQKGW